MVKRKRDVRTMQTEKRKPRKGRGIFRVCTAVLVAFSMVAAPFAQVPAGAQNQISAYAQQSVFVNPIPGLSDTFAKGADVSMLTQLEKCGVKFYDNNVSDDALKIMKESGVNWIRVRIWNDPSQTGGGYCDESNALSLAKRAKELGMKVLLDFHYSDTWVDPGKQNKPAAWENDTIANGKLPTDVYDFTAKVLQDMNGQGTAPDMVQVGNEINNGMLWPDGANSSGYTGLATLLNEGIRAVRDNEPRAQTKVMIHIASYKGDAGDRAFFDGIKAAGVTDFDVIGLSYYPYWHGTLSDFSTTLNDMASRYGKEVAVAETAYAYTLDNYDGTANIFNNKSGSMENKGGYQATVQGQATEVRDVMAAVSAVPGGMGFGVFYWEPDWIAADGAGWAGSDTGDGWDNQAMFDRYGNALASLKVFNLVSGTQASTAIVPVSVVPSTVTATAGTVPSMPSTTFVIFNDGSIQSKAVTWDAIPSSVSGTAGNYQVKGTVTVSGVTLEADALLKVNSDLNAIKNGGFENGTDSWTVTGNATTAKATNSAAYSGSYGFNFWKADAFTLDLSQTVTGLTPGYYLLSAKTDGQSGTGSALSYHMYAKDCDTAGTASDQTTVTVSGWHDWQTPKLVVHVTGTGCTVGFSVNAAAGDWGDIDEVSLVPCDASGTPTQTVYDSLFCGSTGADSGSFSVGLNMLRALQLNGLNAAFHFQNITVSLPSNLLDFSGFSNADLQNGSLTLENQFSSDGGMFQNDTLKAIGHPFTPAMHTTDGAGTQTPITQFGSKKATISVQLTADELSGVDPSKLSAYSFDADSRKWVPVGGRFNAATSVFTFTTSYFAKFSVMESVPKSMSSPDIAVAEIPNQLYTGSAVAPSVTVRDGDTVLKSGTDYTLSYQNNTDVGTASVTIAGTGNYTGSMTRNFTIESSPTIAVTCAPGSSLTDWAVSDQLDIACTVGSSNLKSVAVSRDGSAAQDITDSYRDGYTAAQNGSYRFTVTSNSGFTASQTIVIANIDTSAPALSGITGNPTLPSVSAFLSVTAKPGKSGIGTVSVSREQNGAWEEIQNASIADQINADGSHTYTYTAVQNGTYRFTVTSSLGVAAVSDSADVTQVDTAAPVVCINANGYADGTWTNQNVKLDISDSVHNIGTTAYAYSIDGGKTWEPFGKSLTDTEEGTKTYSFRATSAAGVVGDSRSITVKIDKTAPCNMKITFVRNPFKTAVHFLTFGLFFRNTVDVHFSAADSGSGINHYEYQVVSRGGTFRPSGTWHTGALSVPPDFKGTVYARAVDNAGNVSETAAKSLFRAR